MKKLKLKLIFCLFLLSFFVFNSCIQVFSPVTQNSTSYYNPSTEVLHPEFNIYHQSDDISDLNLKIFPNELKYIQSTDKQILNAKIRIHYEIYPSFSNTQILDSSTVHLKLNKTKTNAPLSSFIQVKIKKGSNYVLAVEVYDVYSKNSTIQLISINKNNDFSRQNYNGKYENLQTIFDSNINKNDSFFIKYKNQNLNRMFISYFKNKFPLAIPPHININIDSLSYLPDSTKLLTNYSNQLSFKQTKVGFYLYRVDTSFREGLGFATFGTHFPSTKRAEEMVDPLQYITTKKEFIKLKSQLKIKESVDEFWLKFGETPDKTRELIRIYYNRLLYANIFFSAHTEGWRTDRGMIYMIYGPPYTVSKTDVQETWNYSENRNNASIRFIFNKISNPLTENYYVLKREAYYQAGWQEAVMAWRSGIAYSLSK